MSSIKGLEWTFDTVAETYTKMRPDYIQELYDTIFRYIPIDDQKKVIEVGIGGGEATEPFLRTGCVLTALEYGEKFTKICQNKFKSYPNFAVIKTKFEDFQFQESSYDLIYAATAFHWIPEETGYPQVYHMLKKGGAFARFAIHPYVEKYDADKYEALQKIYAVYMPGKHGAAKEYTEENAKLRANIAKKYGFEDIQYELYSRARSYTTKEYTALLSTYSDHIALEKERRSAFLREIENTIDQFGGRISIFDIIDLQLARKI